jgi:uncharacterized MAPEG superfamily protein
MQIELLLLALSAALCLALTLPYTTALVLKLGLPAMVGNREDFPALEGWVGRARRAHANMVENLVPFAALIVVAAITNKFGQGTAIGAQLFFWGRVAHASAYIAGIPWLRTGAFLISYTGMVLIFIALVR